MLWFMAMTDASLSRPFWKGLSMCISLILHETLLLGSGVLWFRR